MMFNKVGITTGLLGYSLKKEFFNDSIPYREIEVFNYEVYSSDNTGLSPATIQTNIYNQLTGFYSGDINVKVFNVQSDYSFPNDSIRAAKYDVTIEIKRSPNLSGFSELGSGYYNGLDINFFNQYSSYLLDFSESFDFDKSDNGISSLNHSISFGLLSGGKNLATQIASGLFGTDYNIPLGAVAFVSGLTGANPNLVQNYYTETYDLIRNSFSFGKKREFLPADYSGLNYNLHHNIALQEDGILEVNERCDLKAKISFVQAQQGLSLVYGGAYSRCSDYYNVLKNYLPNINAPTNSASLFNNPKRYVQTFNRPSLEASYDVTYTNDPQFANSGAIIQETIELDINNKNIVTISDKYAFTFNKKIASPPSAASLIATNYAASPSRASGYYNASSFKTTSWPINLIKYDMTWPSNKNQASLDMIYSNNPRNNVSINGVLFKTLDYSIENEVPQDIIQEYKIINRPNKLSVINYAYQTEKGQFTINFTASIGRITNEFFTGFRNDIGPYLYALYQYSFQVFMGQFNSIVPINFTYYLSDVKYSLTNDGVLTMACQYAYTVKKYVI